MERESIGNESYKLINQSANAVKEYINLINKVGLKDYMHKGELKLSYENVSNIRLLKTNLDMLNENFSTRRIPNEIILLSEMYLNKLGAIGTLTLEQIATSVLGKYNPFEPNKKVPLEKIKKTIETYSGEKLSDSFFNGFYGIFEEVRTLRNEAAHSNLVQRILSKEPLKQGSWDSQREKDLLWNMQFKSPSPEMLKGDLLIDSKNGEIGLTEKLDEYGSKYLTLVKDVYEGIKDYRGQFIVDVNGVQPDETNSSNYFLDLCVKDIEKIPFEVKLGK